MNVNEDCNPVVMIHRLACCFSRLGVMASQVAVLTSVANQPSATSGVVVRQTGLSTPNAIRLLNLLTDEGEVTFVREEPTRPDHVTVTRHYYAKPEGMATIRLLTRALGWEENSRFLIPERDVVLNPVQMLNRLACCFTKERLMASQVAVLTAVANTPSITSAMIVKSTGLNLPNSIRILNYLTEAGDLTFIPEREPNPGSRPVKRHFYVTPEGMGTIRRVMRHLGWGALNEFHIVVDLGGNELFHL